MKLSGSPLSFKNNLKVYELRDVSIVHKLKNSCNYFLIKFLNNN